jgi:hypothetical protein
MQLALAARHRVRSLALLCTSSRGSDATGLTLPMFWLRLRTGARTPQMHGGSFQQIIMPHHPGSGQGRDIIVERFKSLFGYPFATSHCVVMRQLRALKRFDASARLQELAGIPTMVLSATEGRIFPPGMAGSWRPPFPMHTTSRFPAPRTPSPSNPTKL